MAERVMLTINLGANAPIEALRKMIDDLDTVCQFGGKLQYKSALANAEAEVLRRPSAWFAPDDDPDSVNDFFLFENLRRVGGDRPSGIGPAVSRYLQEYDPLRGTTTTVERLHYENPIEIVLSIGGALTLYLLRLIRDWPARRRLNAATASDVEDTMAARLKIRNFVTEGVLS